MGKAAEGEGDAERAFYDAARVAAAAAAEAARAANAAAALTSIL